MFGIEDVAVEIPLDYVDNTLRGTDLDFTSVFLHNKIGSPKLSRISSTDTVVDLACRAIEKLISKGAVSHNDIDLLVLVSQTPSCGNIPHLSARVHRKLGLRQDVHFFDISLGCSGWVSGLSVVYSLCESFGFRKALLVTADPYSLIIDANDRNTALLFGDGASATLVSNCPKLSIGKFSSISDSAACDAISLPENGLLHMNGRAVMDFARNYVPGCIQRNLELNAVGFDDVDRFYLHQGSKYIVDILGRALGVGEAKVPYMAGDYGNLVSSSIPAMLAADWGKLPNLSVVCGFGVGLSAVSTVLRRSE